MNDDELIAITFLILRLLKNFNLCHPSRKVRSDNIKIMRIDPVAA
jgi:hypothetical protein